MFTLFLKQFSLFQLGVTKWNKEENLHKICIQFLIMSSKKLSHK